MLSTYSYVGCSVDHHLDLHKRAPNLEWLRSPKPPTFPRNRHSAHFVDVFSVSVHENDNCTDYFYNNPNAPVLPIVSEIRQRYPVGKQ